VGGAEVQGEAGAAAAAERELKPERELEWEEKLEQELQLCVS